MKIEEILDDIPVLETERLILRKLNTDDLEDMFEYGSDGLKMYSILLDEEISTDESNFRSNDDHITSTASKIKLKLADNNYLPEIIELHKDEEVREMLGVIDLPDENYLKKNNFLL